MTVSADVTQSDGTAFMQTIFVGRRGKSPLEVKPIESLFTQREGRYAETPGIDQRQANQEQRIDHGIASGQLTQREADKLDKQQQHIDKMENKAKSDGVVTKKERSRLHAAQDRASKNIFREKHDRQKSRHQ